MSNHKFIYSIFFSHQIILLLGIVILFSGCANEDEPEQEPVNRTVLIYMLSNNNLGSTYRFDTQNINDMLQVAASGGLNGGNLIIYRDGYDTNPQLIQIRKNESGSAEKAIIKEYPDRNSATTEVMRSVIDETKELFPAKEYGLILWSHSTGWAPGNSSLALSPARRYELPTRSFGQDGKNYMEIDELAEAIPDKQFHFILTDVCFMGGIECAYQLRNKTDYYIGSAAEVLGAGMPYSLKFSRLIETMPCPIFPISNISIVNRHIFVSIYKIFYRESLLPMKIQGWSKPSPKLYSTMRQPLRSWEMSPFTNIAA